MHGLRPTLVWLGLTVAIHSTVAAQVAADSGSTSLSRLVAELPPSGLLRFTSGGERWTGRLSSRHPDSLTVTSRSQTRTSPLSAIDTLWLRGKSHTALAAGAGFGALMFALLQLGHGGDRYTATRLGAIIFVGAAGAGLLIDEASERWSQRYPER